MEIDMYLSNALKVLTTNYPSTKFYGLTPLIRGDKGFPVVNSTGLSLDDYTNRMISIYRTFGVEVIDLRELSINTVNLGLFSADLLHMNKLLGQPRLANHVISKIHS